MPDDIKLPELPDYDPDLQGREVAPGVYQRGHTDDAMHAYARAAVKADRAQWPAWQPIETAPKDGTSVLLLLDSSDVPHAARWLSGPDDPRATDETTKPGWYFPWDGYQVTEYDGPVCWMPLPPGPGEAAQPADAALLQRALAALEYHRAQTRPIAQTDAVIEALHAALSAKGGE